MSVFVHGCMMDDVTVGCFLGARVAIIQRSN